MSCHLLDAYIDRELDIVRSLDFEDHLTACTACRARAEAAREISRALRHPSLYYPAPTGFAPNASAPARWARRFRLPAGFSPIILTAAAAALLISAILILRPTPTDPIAEQVVSSHIRSLMAGHLTDVASSDQHTVKPWFAGRLDYAPMVHDLASSGYPLAGGRLDYIAARPVAALVYTHRLHEINVFLWPSPAGDSAPRVLTANGYNVLHWTHSGMTWWAVSDMNANDLGIFARQLETAH
jgi:anti-sigma factor RsiW